MSDERIAVRLSLLAGRSSLHGLTGQADGGMFRHVMSIEAVRETIERVLESVRPALRRDGGDVEFVSVAEGVVSLRLSGACATCGMSALTLKMGLEPAIVAAVPGITKVIAI